MAASMLADDDGKDWMYAVARSLKKSKPLDLSAAVARVGKCWRWQLYLTHKGIAAPFGSEVPYMVLPLSAIFILVYLACNAMRSGHPAGKQKKTPLARP